MPLISVIIPVYNGEKTIRETIQSVLNQTFSDLELIVINDGSQDATLEIVSSITDPRVKVFSYPNSGQAESRNRGIAHSSGEYISFIDADDLWTPDKLETQLRALQENPEAAVAYSWTNYIDESGKFLRKGAHLNYNGDVYARLLLADFVGSGSNPLIRRQALAEIGGFDKPLTPNEDWDMWLRLADRYHFVAVPKPQILYRQSPNSSSTNVLRQEAASLQMFKRVFAEAPDYIRRLKQTCLANRYKCFILKALEGNPGPRRYLSAARFLWLGVIYDPSLLRRRVTWKALLKIAIGVLLPPPLAQSLLAKMGRLANLEALMFHLWLEPSENTLGASHFCTGGD